MGTRLTLLRPGLVAYHDAWVMQRRIAAEVADGADETLILLQHPPTYTLGARGGSEHLLTSAAALEARGASVVRSDRGGDVTFHGPGQIVGYPIINLRRRGIGPVRYVRGLEETLITALAGFGVHAWRVDARPGAWCASGKIAAIGVRVSRGVTTHGFALNGDPDLSYFDHIVPCGIADAGVTSMTRELGYGPRLAAVEDALAASFGRTFGLQITPPDLAIAGVHDGR